MKLIELSKKGKNKGKYFAMVDDEDFDWLNKFSWHVVINKTNNTIYASRSVRDNGKTQSFFMHREILKLDNANIFADHIDRNGLNCQKLNLRHSTNSQNQMNRISVKDTTSKYKGVSWHKRSRKWDCRICCKGEIYNLGTFKKEIDAALAYNTKAIELHGEFALLNSIQY